MGIRSAVSLYFCGGVVPRGLGKEVGLIQFFAGTEHLGATADQCACDSENAVQKWGLLLVIHQQKLPTSHKPQATSHKEQALPAVSCSGVTRHPSNEIRPIKEIAVKNMIGNLRCEWSLAGQPPLRAVVARTKRNSRQNIIGNHRCKRWFAGANCALGPRALLCVLTVVLLCR